MSEKPVGRSRFIENFCHHCETRDDLIKLELWQKATVSLIFGIVDREGCRIFREVVIIIGRKNGKSIFASAIVAYTAYIRRRLWCRKCIALLPSSTKRVLCMRIFIKWC